MSQICGQCDSRHITTETCKEHFSPRGGVPFDVVGYQFFRCEDCGFEFITPELDKVNMRLVADARRKAEGKLTAAEIEKIRVTFGLSLARAAVLFGGGPNAFAKYRTGEVVQSVPMDTLLRAYSELPVLRNWLEMRAGSHYQLTLPVVVSMKSHLHLQVAEERVQYGIEPGLDVAPALSDAVSSSLESDWYANAS